MASDSENRRFWDDDYDWSGAGTEWSEPWGSPYMQWCITILPRIGAFVPGRRMLEIAPGYGRWTHYLRALCGELVGVDLSERCIGACRQRFAAFPELSFFVNDGYSLAGIADQSIDFAFSFDSLVHADPHVMLAYAGELARVLTPDGAAFLHHSNLGQYSPADYPENIHWRDPQMTADKMAGFAQAHGLKCLSQELVNWQTESVLIDCFSVLVRQDSRWQGPALRLRNPSFMQEAERARGLRPAYERSKGS